MSKLFHARSLPSFRQLPRQTCKTPAPVFKSAVATAKAIVITLSLEDTVFLQTNTLLAQMSGYKKL